MNQTVPAGSSEISSEAEFTVEFYEVDSMEVVWHGNYVNYLERARCALLNRIGYGYEAMKESGYVFPVTEVSLKYVRPLHLGEKARVRAVLDEYENMLRIKYTVFNAAGQIATKAVSTQMAFDIEKNDSCFVCPRIFTDKVEQLIAKGAAAAGKAVES